MRRAIVLALLIAGCGDGGGTMDASSSSDMNIGDVGANLDGTGPLRATFTVVGCDTLDTSTGEPRCSGRAPLQLTFVPLGAGLSAFVWTFTGGAPATSKLMSPMATFATPGTYAVTLAAGGTAGATTATGTVVVSSGVTGSPCLADTDCDAGAGLFCVCKPGEAGCVGALAVGFCSRDCSGSLCDAGEICADFTRGGAFTPASADGGNGGAGDDGGSSGGSGDVWRRALCVPACTVGSNCATGLSCRSLPTLAGGALAGSAFSWRQGCFADVSGDDGDACLSAAGTPDATRCLSGRCDRYGARGLCTSDCATSDDCPSTAACAAYNAPPASAPKHACLRRCDATYLCNEDPLLDCEAAQQLGGLGFTVAPAEAASTRYCAPLRCATQAQCDPSGTCTPTAGGSFCLRN